MEELKINWIVPPVLTIPTEEVSIIPEMTVSDKLNHIELVYVEHDNTTKLNKWVKDWVQKIKEENIETDKTVI